MTTVFADSFFYLAIVNPKDAAHQSAVAEARTHTGGTITTHWVLVEVFNALCRQASRQSAVALWHALPQDQRLTIIPPTQTLFDRRVSLYAQRSDKDWSLTDCVSFIVMEEYSLRDALIGDHHFEQAGFHVLL